MDKGKFGVGPKVRVSYQLNDRSLKEFIGEYIGIVWEDRRMSRGAKMLVVNDDGIADLYAIAHVRFLKEDENS